MDHHIPLSDLQVVLHLERHQQDLQHHHNDQGKHLPLNRGPCLRPDQLLQAHPIPLMDHQDPQQVRLVLMGLLEPLQVALQVVHTVVLQAQFQEVLQVVL